MNVRSTIAAISCVTLVAGGVVVWHFVHAAFAARQLANEITVFRLKAERGDAISQFKLGSMYQLGKGMPKNYGEALRWYRKSAEQGYAKAEYNLSNMYHDGTGVPQDFAEAERWCRKAAEQGDARAEAGLAYLYYSGEGIPKDLAEAAVWYRKAANQGDGYAQYALGYMYSCGYGVSQDKVEANRLFHEAAAQGNEDAMRAIGQNRVNLPASGKLTVALKFLGGLVFLIHFLRPWQSQRTRATTPLAGLFCICSGLLDLYWYFYAGQLQSATSITTLYFARHLMGGVAIAMCLFILLPKSSRAVLTGSFALFIAFIVFRIFLCELRHVPLTIRFFCFSGLFIGTAIPSAIFLWLDSNSRGIKKGRMARTRPLYRSRSNDC